MTQTAPRIVLQNVSVNIPLLSARHLTLTNAALRFGTGGKLAMSSANVPFVMALDDVTMDLKAGTRLGLTGHNGAGKTTLLRVMAGILPPTKGTSKVSGRVALIINPTMGLNPELTGREAIRVMSLIGGATRAEYLRAFNDIADFTELGPFIDLPVSTYSTGMRMRLAFATATAYPAEIILIDEGIGAGDADFAAKAAHRLRAWLGAAGIVVIASHSDALLAANCDRLLRLDKGKVVESAPA